MSLTTPATGISHTVTSSHFELDHRRSCLSSICAYPNQKFQAISNTSNRTLMGSHQSSNYLDNSGKNNNGQSLYGGKYAGLEMLSSLLVDTNIKVPEYMGLSFADISAINKTGKLPKKLTDFLKNFKDMPNAKFMVRSSSTQEDQAGQSNAGCFDTISNVQNTPAAFLAAIKKVHTSFRMDSAQTQNELYNKNTEMAGNNANHGAIIIQLMVGETPRQAATIPTSGVGLSPDPRSHAPGTFNINASLGHGEGVVQSLVATDETIGIINPHTKEVHARTKVTSQDQRMAPRPELHGLTKLIAQAKLMALRLGTHSLTKITAQTQRMESRLGLNHLTKLIAQAQQIELRLGTHGLTMEPNINAKGNEQKLSDTAIASYAKILDRLAQEHPTGVDLEFVARGEDQALFAVQQRSQDEVNVSGTPQYLSEAFIQQHQDQTQSVIMKSYGTYGVSEVTREQRLVANTLDHAFFDIYLTMQKDAKTSGIKAPDITAVFVSPPANPNSHAALMFRQQGISIIEVNDDLRQSLEHNDKTVVLDEQRGLLLQDTKIEPDNLVNGRFSYPAEPVYSMLGKKADLTPAETKTLKMLFDKAQVLRQSTDKKASFVCTEELLDELKQQVIADKDIDKAKAKNIIARLVERNAALLLSGQKQHNQPLQRCAFEMNLDLARLTQAIDNNGDTIHKLLYLNWIKAAANQMPEKHPEAQGIQSIKSSLRNQKTMESFNGWLFAVSSRHSAADYAGKLTPNDRNPQDLSTDGKVAAFILHRASYQLSNPELKKRWLSSVSDYLRRHDVPENQLIALAQRSVEALQTGFFKAMVGDTALRSDEKNINIEEFLSARCKPGPALGILKQANLQLSQIKDQWAEPSNFADRLSMLTNLQTAVNNCVDQISGDAPFASIVLMGEVERAIEQLDTALKILLTSSQYNDTTRVDHFKQLLKGMKDVATPILEKAYGLEKDYRHPLPTTVTTMDIELNGRLKGYLGFYENFDKLMQSDSTVLMPTEHFNVSMGIITRSIGTSHASEPVSIGDLHTLLHQNARMALGKVVLETGAIRCLPEKAKMIDKNLPELVSARNYHRDIFFPRTITLTSVAQTDKGHRWQYAYPLRDHGLRIALELDEENQELTVSIAMDGQNENKRYAVAASVVGNSRKAAFTVNGFTSGKQAWPESATSHDNTFAWTEKLSDNNDDFEVRIASVIAKSINISYEFANGTFTDSALHKSYSTRTYINRTYRVFEMLNGDKGLQHSELSSMLARQDLEGVARYLYPRLQPRLADNLSDALKAQHLPLPKEISLENLKHLIQDQGLLDGKISLYEFDRVLQTQLSDQQAAKDLLAHKPHVFWNIMPDHFKAYEDQMATLQQTGINPDFAIQAPELFAKLVLDTPMRPENLKMALDAINTAMQQGITGKPLLDIVGFLRIVPNFEFRFSVDAVKDNPHANWGKLADSFKNLDLKLANFILNEVNKYLKTPQVKRDNPDFFEIVSRYLADIQEIPLYDATNGSPFREVLSALDALSQKTKESRILDEAVKTLRAVSKTGYEGESFLKELCDQLKQAQPNKVGSILQRATVKAGLN